jgi:hypothetical protein
MKRLKTFTLYKINGLKRWQNHVHVHTLKMNYRILLILFKMNQNSKRGKISKLNFIKKTLILKISKKNLFLFL